MGLFWILALTGLALPWLPSCQSLEPTACAVNSIYDGDTMRLTCDGRKVKVRLYCIDAPEMQQRPWGKESRDYLRAITPRQVKVIEHGKDRYGRIIGEVWTDDGDEVQENLNLAMVWAGRAVVYPRYCSEGEYYTAQKKAKGLKSGVWRREGDWQRPWVSRH
jgi:endonuclease YncB( thermonuclease family)